MYVPSLIKIPSHLLKLLSGNENMGESWVDIYSLAISNQISTLSMHIQCTKFGENPLIFTHHPEMKYGWTDD